jgi:putative ABC transport system permease protein
MTRHLLRLMWNRKRQNLLLVLEVGVAFLVVVVVAVLGLHFGRNSMLPLGFDAEDVWTLEVSRGRGVTNGADRLEGDRITFRQLVTEVQALSAVRGVAGAFTGPYRWYSWTSSITLEGRPPISTSMNRVDDAFADVMGLRVVAGRWFSREDNGTRWEPIVINRALETEMFGGESAVGRELPEVVESETREGEPRRPRRVVGVVEDFRQFGELSTPTSVMFQRSTLDDPASRLELPNVLLLKVAPGTTAALEEVILRRLRAVAPDWTIGLTPIAALREAMLREGLVSLAVVAIVAGSMLLMVSLGLTGVVWQNVTQRMREFGLRRAQGATGAGVGRQVIAELVIMVSFAIVLCCLLLIQMPLLPLPPELMVPRSVFFGGVAVAIVAVYSVTIACAWYPSRLATGVPPAEALRYE